MPGSTTTAFRPQIAESLALQVRGTISACRLEQSEFQTCRIRPVPVAIVTTWPWYGGASPM